MPGSCTRRLSASAPTSRGGGGEALRHFARVVGGDRLIRAERVRRRGVALVDGSLALDQRGGQTAQPHPADEDLRARTSCLPEGARQAGEPRRCRHPFHQDARAAPGRPDGGGHRDGRAEHGDRRSSAGEQGGVPLEPAQVLAAEHGDEPRKLRLEALDRVGLADAGRLEVQWQRARGHPETYPTGVTGLQPRHLLRHERSGPEWEQEWRRGGPPRRVLGQDEGRHLQRLGHVPGEATVVLAGHDPVEAAVEGETGLRAELADDVVGGKFVVRVQPDGDRSRGERGTRRGRKEQVVTRQWRRAGLGVPSPPFRTTRSYEPTARPRPPGPCLPEPPARPRRRGFTHPSHPHRRPLTFGADA